MKEQISEPKSQQPQTQEQQTVHNTFVGETTQKKENPFFDNATVNPFLTEAANPFLGGVSEKASPSPILQKQASEGATPPKQATQAQKENHTGLPDALKSGIEQLSGYTLDDVKVHYNSSKPAQLKAHAYAQGTDIHLGAGQEKHLPHEAWHVVQQKQGRVKPTLQMKGDIKINDDKGLEREADIMGAKALQVKGPKVSPQNSPAQMKGIAQREENTEVGSDEKKVIEEDGGAIQAKLKNASIGSSVAQMAFVARRNLDFTGSGLLRFFRSDAYHEHIFFEDEGNPPNIGFHDGGLYQENFEDFDTYVKVRENLDDGRMRNAVAAVGNPGTYKLFSNNCQDYVDAVMSQY